MGVSPGAGLRRPDLPPLATAGKRGLVTLGETMALFGATEVSQAHRQQRFVLTIAAAESNVAIGVSRLGVQST